MLSQLVAPSARSVPPGEDADHADECVDLASIAGLDLFEWQADTIRGAMRRRGDRWAAREVAVIVPRQNGKGSILEARQLWGLFQGGERLQVHTAHEFKTCYEHFRRLKSLVEASDLLSKQVKIIRTGAGDQSIELKNGNRIRFLARSRTSGKGFSPDVVYLDEAFHLDEATMGALLPALSARPDAQIWYTSSAPYSDSLVLHRVRERMVAGDDDHLFAVEWGNDDDVDPFDRDAWRRANPSLGLLIAEESVAAELAAMSDPEFRRERLGVPEPPLVDRRALDMARWNGLHDDRSVIARDHAWALAVAPDRAWGSIGIAGRRDDGLIHVEWWKHEPGTDWIVAAAVEMFAKRPIPVRIAANSAEASLIDDLREAGVEVEEITAAGVARATGELIDAVNNYRLRHLGQRSLTKCVEHAELKTTESGASVWRDLSEVEITPLKAVTVALGGVMEHPDRSAASNVW